MTGFSSSRCPLHRHRLGPRPQLVRRPDHRQAADAGFPERLRAVLLPGARGQRPEHAGNPTARRPRRPESLRGITHCAVGNGTIVLALEALIVIGFVRMAETGVVPKFALLASFAWLMRSTWAEISYWHELTQNQVAPAAGQCAAVGTGRSACRRPSVPFLVAERFLRRDACLYLPAADGWRRSSRSPSASCC